MRRFLAAAAFATCSTILAHGQQPVPAPAPPYQEEEVTFANGDVKLAGTLTVPPGKGPFPAIVMLTGSGAQNRDEEIVGFKPFKLIAEYMGQRGIAVLRYDDRGVGGSTGSMARSTTEDFAADALAAMAWLAKRPEINARQIGLVGHSEGAIAAAVAAARSKDLAFIVMIAGTAVRGDDVLRRQAEDLSRAGGADDAAVAKILEAHRRLTDAIRAGAPEAELKDAVSRLARAQIEAAPEAQRLLIGDVDAFIARMIDAQVKALTSPWMRFFITFDPATALAQVSCPVLAIFGGRDVQVPVALNRPPLEKALAKNTKVTVKLYPEANHLFQSAKTGLPQEYAALEKQFLPGLLDDIRSWIGEQLPPK
jgi:uncharacterized protein